MKEWNMNKMKLRNFWGEVCHIGMARVYSWSISSITWMTFLKHVYLIPFHPECRRLTCATLEIDVHLEFLLIVFALDSTVAIWFYFMDIVLALYSTVAIDFI